MKRHEAATRLAEFTVRTKLEDLTPQALLAVKQLALKTFAGMLAGSSMEAGIRIADFVRKNPDGNDVSVVGTNFKASLWKATFANAFFAHQSELEDDRLNTGTAWDITTFPMLLPLAQIKEMTGADMLLASAVGLEVMARTCQFFPQGHMGLSIVPSSVGPAALASRAYGLNIEQTVTAFGLAMSGVPLAYTNFGTDAHYFETSVQTLHGLMAAQSAPLGLSSNPDLVRYIGGLLGADRISTEAMVDKLGEYYQFTEIWVKKYPCCLYMHRYIDGMLEIIREHNFKIEDVSKVRLHVASGAMEEVCNRPLPQTVGDLQFSFQHAMSATILDRDVNYRHICVDRVTDSAFVEARKKVEVVAHPEWKSRLLVETPALLEVEFKDGRKAASERQYPTGTQQEPLTLDFVKGLFIKFVGDNLPEADKKYAADAIAEMERLDRKDVLRLLAVMSPS